jgi:YfiH family protein
MFLKIASRFSITTGFFMLPFGQKAEKVGIAVQATELLLPVHINRTGTARGAFTTRLDGVSSDQWTSLNLGLHVGDKETDVLANREIVSKRMGVSLDDWICGEQVHGKNVAILSDTHRGRGAKSYSDSIPETDALVTNKHGIVLATFAADCVPILLFDPVTESIAAVHAGWKGTKSRIIEETIRVMQEQFGAKAHDVVAAIGPSIDACCYEVDSKVFIPFIEEYPAGESFFTPHTDDKWHLSLPEANHQILLESGVTEQNIERVGGCTACQTELFFSHRKEKGRTGRHAGLIFLA